VWAGHIRLAGYALASEQLSAGQPGQLTLFWQGIRDEDLNQQLVIQMLDARGEPVRQFEQTLIEEEIPYYENRDGLVTRQHLFWLGPETPSGLYLLRLGLFQPESGVRLPLTSIKGESLGDQIILAPFYIEDSGQPPRPETPLVAGLGEGIELMGYTLEQPLRTGGEQLTVKLYWRATQTVETDYTAFIQLLDAQNQVVSQWDTQPLGGLYPTSRWQPGQILLTEFPLPLTGDLATGPYRLVTGMYDFSTGLRLPTFDSKGQALPDNMITLTQMTP
jgi:hypothetical protein